MSSQLCIHDVAKSEYHYLRHFAKAQSSCPEFWAFCLRITDKDGNVTDFLLMSDSPDAFPQMQGEPLEAPEPVPCPADGECF